MRRRNDRASLVPMLCAFALAACDSPAPTDLASSAPDLGLNASVVSSNGRTADTHDAEVALAWYRLGFQLTEDEAITPPPAARIFGYTGVTLWEAVAPGIRGGKSLAGQLHGLERVPRPRGIVHWPAVVNSALATIQRRFYTQQLSTKAIIDRENAFNAQFAEKVPPEILKRSILHGHQVANAIWDWSTTDGYELINDCAYTPPVGSGLWQPTPPGFDAAVQPCWGQLRLMLLSAPDACDPGLHPEYSEDPASEFYQQAFEVYDVGNHLTEEQRIIALFWADLAGESPTPAGHSLSIGAQAVEIVGGSLALAAEAFARVGISEMDSFISAWAAKYKYNLLRPITFIHAFFDPAWTSTLDTPPFPAYTSGHSNDVGGASTVMTVLFGDNFAFTDHTLDSKGFAPRSFNSFFEAADESAISRLYGGIHYRFDIENGVQQGACVGTLVNGLQLNRHDLVSD
jgi:hypothetical protein